MIDLRGLATIDEFIAKTQRVIGLCSLIHTLESLLNDLLCLVDRKCVKLLYFKSPSLDKHQTSNQALVFVKQIIDGLP